ncbi:conserved hypothetical protein [Leishmania major strain Friedlin]|uniref:DUF4455 domain-containing protein n=1 Tax=Leishmania major TaxID=5664 RepID=E9AC30_LEIMA|nr:conserved hypothetical protein [Leishmania major strain Friedlin]CAG9567104.1 hypothetical_protein_-_conserved [Leishmania major strain Friedlin]CBZ11844.1 conserved hypothetical protein [Leishmania major strain Friedlin]|eukprot:XP_003721561.1 conserved hypothetical protein [Leishmania major strain Friedlin]
MQRPPRPQPTRLSPYFFQQVVSHVPHAAVCAGDGAEAGVSDGLQPQGSDPLRSEAAAAEPATTVACSPSVSPLPSMSAPGANAGVLDLDPDALAAVTARADAGAPVRVTSDAATDAVMWQYFTPASFRQNFEAFMRAESAQTESLRRAVEAAWRDVEQIQQRNVVRRATLTDILADPGAAWREEVRAKVYWQAADIVQRYGFDVVMDEDGKAGGGEAEQAGRERITLDFSVSRERVRANRGGSSSSSGDDDEDDDIEDAVSGLKSSPQPEREPQPLAARLGTQAAAADPLMSKPQAKAHDNLLNPCARAHFLRHIFAPLQRMRDSLPKWTTLLLQDVHDVQKAALPSLEKRVQDSVLFKVPLHRPFLDARVALQSCVQQRRVAPDAEVAQVPAYRQLEQHGKLWIDFVQAHESAAAAVAAAAETERLIRVGGPVPTADSSEDEIADVAQRWATAEALWTLLLDELDTCKCFFADAIHRRNAVHEGVTVEMESLQQSVHRHRHNCDATVAALKSDAEACAELLSRNRQRMVTAVEEMEKTFISERDRLQQSITQGEALLTRLAGQQEKCVRRVREALKAFFTEQLQYEEAAQALLQDHLSLTHLEASHGELRQALQLGYKGALDSRENAAALLQLLTDGDTAVRQLFDACEAHCRRIETENHFIQCRLVDQCTLALQQRCRCVHAMAALYEQRYATLEARSGDSWQRQFLLSGERDWAVANLSDVRAELVQLEQDWRKVCALREELELEPAQLNAHVLTPEWQRLLSTLRNLDAPPSLQRRLPTLRAHAAEKVRPAAGCGQQAVRHLLRDAAAAAQASVLPAP